MSDEEKLLGYLRKVTADLHQTRVADEPHPERIVRHQRVP
jgi:hypothetical protein